MGGVCGRWLIAGAGHTLLTLYTVLFLVMMIDEIFQPAMDLSKHQQMDHSQLQDHSDELNSPSDTGHMGVGVGVDVHDVFPQHNLHHGHHHLNHHQVGGDEDEDEDDGTGAHEDVRIAMSGMDVDMDDDEDDDDDDDEDDEEEEEESPFANVAQGLEQPHRDWMLAYWQQLIDSVESDHTDFKSHALPLARIKRVMKCDEDVKMISAEAPILFAKACDIFITEITMRAWAHAEENKRRTLQKSDIQAAIQTSDIFDFLIDIIPRDNGAAAGAAASVTAPAATASASSTASATHLALDQQHITTSAATMANANTATSGTSLSDTPESQH